MNKSGFIADLDDSAHDFIKIVCPKLRELGFLSGKIIHVESVTAEEMARDLDMVAGIDAWLVQRKGITGLASRIQWGETAWNTFTIREYRVTGAETELAKRLRALRSDGEYIYPYWTCQAYISQRPRRDKDGKIIDGGQRQLLSVALGKMADVCTMITHGQCERRLAPGGNTFAVVEWQKMKELGFPIHMWPNKEPV